MPRVYIGRLSYDVRERDIQRFFSGYGKLMEIDLKNGYGFVELDDNRDADDAVYELSGRELCGERVVVEHARGPRRDHGDGRGPGDGGRSSGYSSHVGRDRYGPPVRTEYRLIVQNLSTRCSWQDLKDLMRQAGEVTYADAHKEHTNEGVVEFYSRSDMKRALDKLDGKDVNGRRIRLVEERPRRRRSYSNTRSRSRSRRWSHSRRTSRSPSHSRSRSRGNQRSRRSPARSGRRSHSRGSESLSRQRLSRRSKSRSKVASRSRSKSRSKAASRSRSMSRSLSHSKSPSRSLSKAASRHSSPSQPAVHPDDTKPASRSPSPRARARHSQPRGEPPMSRSKFRSRSRSASQE